MTSFFPVIYEFITRSASSLITSLITYSLITHYSTHYEVRRRNNQIKEDVRVCWLGVKPGHLPDKGGGGVSLQERFLGVLLQVQTHRCHNTFRKSFCSNE